METPGTEAAVVGALVADAASLGLHWIYDPERLARVAGDRPEFHEPDLDDYRGTTAYFAHPGKRAGDPTHYGAQLLVVLRSLAATGGRFDPADCERRFVDAFGPGGSWVGYIDYATRETLRNLDAADRAALDAARSMDFGPHEDARALMEAKVLASVRRWRGEQLARAMDRAVRVTHGDDAELLRIGREMAAAVERARGGVHGADDAQLPAVSRLPALPPADLQDAARVEAAVRVTNDSDEAVAWALPVARMLAAAAAGAPPAEAAAAARGAADSRGRARLDEALGWTRGPVAAAERFGRACPLEQAVPLSVALLARADGYQAVVRGNILAGGDSAGRAIVVGAVAAGSHPVPADWCARANAVAEARALMAAPDA